MAIRWREYEVEKMLDYRDQGMTESKIADMLSLVFMRKFTQEGVNRKIRDLKRSGYIDKNKRTGRYTSITGERRDGENHVRLSKFSTRSKKYKPRVRKHIVGSEEWLKEMEGKCDTN